MSKNPHLLIDLLGIGRVANLPSVVTNLCVGLAVAIPFSAHSASPASLFTYQIFLSGICLYLAGCFLNDWADAKWDREHKPSRPIPSQRVKKTPLLVVSIVLLILPYLLCASSGSGIRTYLAIGLITLSIITYTYIHKKTPLGIIPMGLCRALLYLLGFFYALEMPAIPDSDGSSYFLWHSSTTGSSGGATYVTSPHMVIFYTIILGPLMLGLLSYIAGLSLLARSESQNIVPRTNRIVAYCLIFFLPLTHLCVMSIIKPLFLLIGIPLVITLIRAVKKMRHSVAGGVSLLLAAICFADLTFQIGLYLVLKTDAGVGVGTSLIPLIITAVCFPLALLLQKIAPAT